MKWASVLCAFVFLCIGDAQAVVSLAGTRLVFDGRFREATLDVSNPGHRQVLIQAWLQNPLAEGPGPKDLPFVVTPHLARLPAQGKQTLRVLYEGVGMPSDRESLLHLYVLEVPRRSDARQQLNIAIRQRINVFYRPKGLAQDPAQAVQALSWQRVAGGSTWKVSNPTPFHVSLHHVAINDLAVRDEWLIEPFAEHSFKVPPNLNPPKGVQRLTFKALTDYGGQRDFCAQSRDYAPFNAQLIEPGDHSSIGKCLP